MHIFGTNGETRVWAYGRLISRFPEEVLDKYTELFFLPLLACLVNDESAACRKMVGLLVGSVMKHASKSKKDALIHMVSTLCGSGELLRRRAASQALGIMVEHLGDSAERYAEKVLTVVSSSVKNLLHKANQEWEVVYFLLLATEKLLRAVPKLAEQGDLDTLSVMVQQKTLVHKHAWVRLSASRIMGTLFCGTSARVGALLKKGGGGFAVIKDLCAQLAATNLDEKLGQQVVKNLCFLSLAIVDNPALCPEDHVDAGMCQNLLYVHVCMKAICIYIYIYILDFYVR